MSSKRWRYDSSISTSALPGTTRRAVAVAAYFRVCPTEAGGDERYKREGHCRSSRAGRGKSIVVGLDKSDQRNEMVNVQNQNVRTRKVEALPSFI